MIKRKLVANEACDAGKIKVNEKIARASYEVRGVDKIKMTLGAKKVVVEVIAINEYVKKEDAAGMYKIVT